MSESIILFFTKELLWVVFLLSLPTVAIASFIGIVVSLFQALTQIQDQTLQFFLKLVGVTFTILITASWMGLTLINYTNDIFNTFAKFG